MAHPLPESPMPRGMAQGNRCMVIMDVLDINLDQWHAWLRAEQDPDKDYFEIADLIVQMISSLERIQAGEITGADPRYLQALCQLNDENLAKIVTMVTGKTYNFMP